MTAFVLLLSAILASIPSFNGDCILLNGMLGPEEWKNADTVRLDPDTEVRFQMDDENLFLAVVFLGPRHTGIDLYIDSREARRMLHVSTALGEKVYQKDQWSDMTWGRNSWWSANVIQTIVEEGRQRFLEPEAFEFQINRSDLGDDISILLHLKRPEKILPAGASEVTSEKWLKLKLG